MTRTCCKRAFSKMSGRAASPRGWAMASRKRKASGTCGLRFHSGSMWITISEARRAGSLIRIRISAPLQRMPMRSPERKQDAVGGLETAEAVGGAAADRGIEILVEAGRPNAKSGAVGVRQKASRRLHRLRGW